MKYNLGSTHEVENTPIKDGDVGLLKKYVGDGKFEWLVEIMQGEENFVSLTFDNPRAARMTYNLIANRTH